MLPRKLKKKILFPEIDIQLFVIAQYAKIKFK